MIDRDKNYYEDLYDRLTIDECRRDEKLFQTPLSSKALKDAKKDNVSEEDLRHAQKVAHELHMYFLKGERYLKKEETIQEWIRRDEEKQKRLDSAVPPENITCDTCGATMNYTDRHLWGEDNKPLFFFECPHDHLPRKFMYEDGTRWEKQKDMCPNCNVEVEAEDVRNGDIITTKLSCSSCDYKHTETLNLSPKEEEEDPNFEKDRARFCLTKEEGEKYREEKQNIEELSIMLKGWKEKEDNKELYDQVEQLPKLSIPQVKELLVEALSTKPYTNLVFEKPIMERVVSLPFTVEDGETANEYNAKQNLKNLIEETLKNTNWRLMSEGISYRLGMLSGRVRVYESEEDLLKLLAKNSKHE